jgi:hypothetical protein
MKQKQLVLLTAAALLWACTACTPESTQPSESKSESAPEQTSEFTEPGQPDVAVQETEPSITSEPEIQDAPVGQTAAEPMNYLVSGDFTATVRKLIPDYVFDGETPRAAVVTLFQDAPFVLSLSPEICAELQEGETYTFLVEEQEAMLWPNELWPNENNEDGMLSEDALILHHVTVSDFRTPEEEEYGLNCWRVACRLNH